MGTWCFHSLGRDVCQGFLQPVITGSPKHRDNPEGGLEKFLLVPEHVHYVAAYPAGPVLVGDRHLSAAQALFEPASPAGSGQLLTS